MCDDCMMSRYWVKYDTGLTHVFFAEDPQDAMNKAKAFLENHEVISLRETQHVPLYKVTVEETWIRSIIVPGDSEEAAMDYVSSGMAHDDGYQWEEPIFLDEKDGTYEAVKL